MDIAPRHAVFTAQVVHLDGDAEVAVTGALDLATVPILHKVLDDLLADGRPDLRVNASALTFLDAAGIGCLIRARQRAIAAGGSLCIASLGGPPLRVLSICNLLSAFAGDSPIAADGPPAPSSV